MARIELAFPEPIRFTTTMEVRIGDINYGNHLSNDCYLKYMQEARMRFFASLGYSEKDFAGTSVIMGDTGIVFKKECFYGDSLRIELAVGDMGKRSFDLYYRFIRQSDDAIVCEGKTGMVCFNYATGKTENVPDAFKQQLNIT